MKVSFETLQTKGRESESVKLNFCKQKGGKVKVKSCMFKKGIRRVKVSFETLQTKGRDSESEKLCV